MTAPLRRRLRLSPTWLALQEARREGLRNALRRRRAQRPILRTPPIRTSAAGPVEVRILTWRRDWINAIWALKSFYHFAGVRWPLHIHDGGLTPPQARSLRRHFPDATLVDATQADRRVEPILVAGGVDRILKYRRQNPSMRKLVDFHLLSTADRVLAIDSDIVFFRRPDLLVGRGLESPVNLYNRDCDYWYSLPLDALDAAFGLRPPPYINSGLALVRRETVDLSAIDGWLAHPSLADDPWVAEQTLHALLGAVVGVDLLPTAYLVDVKPGLDVSTVCKHYPGFFRSGLYDEGMATLVRSGFLRALAGS